MPTPHVARFIAGYICAGNSKQQHIPNYAVRYEPKCEVAVPVCARIHQHGVITLRLHGRVVEPTTVHYGVRIQTLTKTVLINCHDLAAEQEYIETLAHQYPYVIRMTHIQRANNMIQ